MSILVHLLTLWNDFGEGSKSPKTKGAFCVEFTPSLQVFWIPQPMRCKWGTGKLATPNWPGCEHGCLSHPTDELTSCSKAARRDSGDPVKGDVVKNSWMDEQGNVVFLVVALCFILLLFDNWDSCKKKEKKTNPSIPFQHLVAKFFLKKMFFFSLIRSSRFYMSKIAYFKSNA